MSRRQLMHAFAASAAVAQTPRRAVSKPNVLFLMADQHRGDCLHAEGNASAITPNLDRLAKQGARFRHAYSSTPTCTPARACLLTGMSPWNHGMLGYSRVAKKYPVDLPRMMKDAGYFTAAVGKLHYTPQRNFHGYDLALLDESGRAENVDFRSDYRAWFYTEAPNLNPDATGVGWNDYKGKAYVLPERLHPTRWTADVATHFLESYQRPEPFFLKVSFARPHSPYDPPQRWMDRFRDGVPAPVVAPWAKRFEERNSAGDDIWHGRVSSEETRTARQAYYGSVGFVDEQIGRILDTLEKRGLLEETLILYTSDHGDMTGDHNLWRKSYAYEPSARVPMIMRWPEGFLGARRGQVRNEPVELRDIPATIMAAGGANLPVPIDGRGLADCVARDGAGWREWIDLEHDVCYAKENHWNALTDGGEKYIFHALDGEEMLFDLRTDPHETRNLAGDASHAARLREWRGRLVKHFEPRGEPFLKGGSLALRPESMKHSPNYPRA
ncbi:MAG: arylsulfatase [Bryobacterales bacterium]|nr:arylsulfatase [Bryobacterales bacterium]